MATFGGKTRTSGQGRPKGARNKRTVETEARMADAAAAASAALPEAFQGDAHALLMLVYKDVNLDIGLRLDAAKAAIKYEKPALASVDATVQQNVAGAVGVVHTIDPRGFTREQQGFLRDVICVATDQPTTL